MSIFKKVIALLLVLFTVIPLVACAAPQTAPEQTKTATNLPALPSATTQTSNPADKREEYVFVTHASTLEYWKTHEAAIKASAEALPGNCVGYMLGDTGSDAAKMEALLDTMLENKNLAGFVLAGNFPEVYTAAINKAWEKGIPCCTINADLPKSKRLTHLGTDEKKLAYEMARVLHEKIGPGAKVIVSQNMFSAAITAKKRLEGIDQYDKEHEDFEVVAYVDDKGDALTGTTAVSAALVSNPDANGVLGCNASSGIGAAAAVRESARKGKITIVCVDPDKTTVDAIANGEIYATVCSRQFAGVYLAVQIMYAYNHKTLRLIRNTFNAEGYEPVPDYVDTGIYVINANNYKSFMK